MLKVSDRVVVTGVGVVAPGATGLAAFERLLKAGRSVVRHDARLERLNFNCHVSGQCLLEAKTLSGVLSELEQRRLTSTGVRFALVAGHEALVMSGLTRGLEVPDVRRSVVFGGAVPGIDMLRDAFALTDAGRVKKLGSTAVELQMPSTPAAHLAARLGAGGQVTCNSAACATGTEALLLGYERIKRGQSDVVLVGSTEAESPHLWSGFDALRVLSHKYNDAPERASRPLSASASGFVPASGAGALVLERMSEALKRDVPILAEVLGGHVNCGAQLQGGSMTAQNPAAMRRCILAALVCSNVEPNQVDAISGHLTATQADPSEIAAWADALQRRGEAFPWVNAPKSLWGHALTASGAIELVASVIQLREGFLHASPNCEDVHPAVGDLVDTRRIIRETHQPQRLHTFAKANFGFGDVNACVLLGSVVNASHRLSEEP
jgi:3-oxoacyl-(acyl-carrier-protein) synthase